MKTTQASYTVSLAAILALLHFTGNLPAIKALPFDGLDSSTTEQPHTALASHESTTTLTLPPGGIDPSNEEHQQTYHKLLFLRKTWLEIKRSNNTVSCDLLLGSAVGLLHDDDQLRVMLSALLNTTTYHGVITSLETTFDIINITIGKYPVCSIILYCTVMHMRFIIDEVFCEEAKSKTDTPALKLADLTDCNQRIIDAFIKHRMNPLVYGSRVYSFL